MAEAIVCFYAEYFADKYFIDEYFCKEYFVDEIIRKEEQVVKLQDIKVRFSLATVAFLQEAGTAPARANAAVASSRKAYISPPK
ncbi:MAG: hypothetical protein KDE50_09035 [Caldilineaceae bacterium]|nr:hypothetical protein [Caldilineaceae bacterium]